MYGLLMCIDGLNIKNIQCQFTIVCNYAETITMMNFSLKLTSIKDLKRFLI